MTLRRAEQIGRALLLALGLALWLALAPGQAVAQDSRPLKGVALVIGNSAYEHLSALPNPANDARAVESLLNGLGFETSFSEDRDARRLARDLRDFLEDAEGADVAILYYAGHGIEAGGENFLVPVDADLSALDAAGEKLVPISAFVERLQATVPLAILMLDACRDNPFPPGATVRLDPAEAPAPMGLIGLGETRGATRLNAHDATRESLGTVIAFAAEPGKAALDGDPGGNSPYAAAILRHFDAMAGEEFGMVMRMVGEEVYLKTSGRQRPWVNESLRTLLYFGRSAVDHDGEEGEILAERRQLLVTVAALSDVERRRVERVAADSGVPMDALYAILESLGHQAPPDDPVALEALLKAQAGRIAEMMAERTAITSTDPETMRLAALARQALDEGALQAARKFFRQAKDRIEELDDAIERTELDIRARRMEFAAIYSGSGEANTIAFDHAAAAADFERAYLNVRRWDDALTWRYRNRQAVSLMSRGEYQGDTAALAESASVARDALALARRLGEAEALVTAHITLAGALSTHGDRIGDSELVRESARLFAEAVDLRPVEEDPQQWALLQNNLGVALLKIGQSEAGTASLERALTAFRASLTVRTRDAEPYRWALTTSNVATAQWRIGQRSDDISRIEQALSAFLEASAEWTRERAPMDWASTQHNIGAVLQELGSALGDRERLTRSIDAYESAMEEHRRDLVPLHWASTQSNLGNTYLALARLDDGTGWIARAVAAYEAALAERTRERAPLQWATTQNNVGNALALLGRRTGKPDPLKQAVDAYHAALEFRRVDNAPEAWAATRTNLALTLIDLGGYTSGTTLYDAAARMFEEVLAVRTIEASPRGHAVAQSRRGRALRLSGEAGGDEATLLAAAEAYRASLAVYEREGTLLERAGAWTDLGVALLAVAEQTGRAEDGAAASEALETGRAGYRTAGDNRYEAFFAERLARAAAATQPN